VAGGYWRDREEIAGLWQKEHVFIPTMERAQAAGLRHRWERALVRAKGWEEPVT